MHIRQLTKGIIAQVVGQVVVEVVSSTAWPFGNSLLRRGRFANLFVFDGIDEIFVPNAHVDIAIQVTSRHHVLQGPLTLRREHDHVVEVIKTTVPFRVLFAGQSAHFTHISRVHTRVFRH